MSKEEKVELTKADWKDAAAGARNLLKNAMCQCIVYRIQLNTANEKIAEFPEEEPEKKKNPRGWDNGRRKES